MGEFNEASQDLSCGSPLDWMDLDEVIGDGDELDEYLAEIDWDFEGEEKGEREFWDKIRNI